jgi:hypothetical protein
MVAPALLAFAGATASASPAAASEPLPTKTLTVKLTSGPEGTVSTPDVSFSFVVEGAEQSGTLFHCALDIPIALKECSSPFALGPLTPGLHTFYVEATNRAANAYSPLASRTFAVAASAGPGAGSSGGATPPGGGTTPAPLTPVVSSLAQSVSRWRESSALAHIGRGGAKMPKGTTFSFTLNEAATAHLVFTQALSGRSVAGRCVAQTKHNRARHPCRRTATAGTLGLAAHMGSDHVRFAGRLSADKELKPGRYTLTLTATAAGLTSVARSLSFTIVA